MLKNAFTAIELINYKLQKILWKLLGKCLQKFKNRVQLLWNNNKSKFFYTILENFRKHEKVLERIRVSNIGGKHQWLIKTLHSEEKKLRCWKHDELCKSARRLWRNAQIELGASGPAKASAAALDAHGEPAPPAWIETGRGLRRQSKLRTCSLVNTLWTICYQDSWCHFRRYATI